MKAISEITGQSDEMRRVPTLRMAVFLGGAVAATVEQALGLAAGLVAASAIGLILRLALAYGLVRRGSRTARRVEVVLGLVFVSVIISAEVSGSPVVFIAAAAVLVFAVGAPVVMWLHGRQPDGR